MCREGSWLRVGGVEGLPVLQTLRVLTARSVPQVMRHDSASILELDGKEMAVFRPSQPREKWQRKRTHVKLRVRLPGRSGPPPSIPRLACAVRSWVPLL